MSAIVGVLGGVTHSQFHNDDDFSDRLSYCYTTALFIMFAIVVSTKQYVGEPINCWVPAHFTGNHEEYTNNYCWVRNTYYLPYEDHIPKEHESEKRAMVPYYQWIPMILLVQALLYYIPILIWHGMTSHSGIDISSIVVAGKTFCNMDMVEKRNKTLGYMATQMDRYLASQHLVRSGCTISVKTLLARTVCFMCGRDRGNYLAMVYLFIKVLHVANAIGQLFILNMFLGNSFHVYGIDVLSQIITGDESAASPRFPRVTMCDFNIRRLGNIHRYTVQCVLPINLFNEKIFLFIWWWMVFVAATSVFSLINWTLRAAIRVDRHRYIKSHLRLMNKIDGDQDKRIAVKFVENYLRQDGVFVLRLVGNNTDGITVTEFVGALWDNFRSQIVNEDSKNGGRGGKTDSKV